MSKTQRIGQIAGLVAGLTSEDATACEAILSRLKQISSANSDSELASKLGLKYSSVSSAKSRGMIPTAWIINTANLFNISADWLIFGDEKYPEKAPEKAQATPPPTEWVEIEKIPDFNKISDNWALDLTPDKFISLWNQYWDEKEVRRGWLQVEVIKRFPEFLEWLEQQRGERLIMPHPGTLKRGGMVSHGEVGMGLQDE